MPDGALVCSLVALHEESVDRNSSGTKDVNRGLSVALRKESVDSNNADPQRYMVDVGCPPREEHYKQKRDFRLIIVLKLRFYLF